MIQIIKLQMDKKQTEQTDIFQFLTSCLKSFKRKIVIFIKIYLRQSNYQLTENNLNKAEANTPFRGSGLSLEEIYKQLTKQMYQSKKRVQHLTKQQFVLIDDSNLLQRFVGRVREIIRMYLPQASVSQDIFHYLKKIENFNFRQENNFLNYLINLVQDAPKFIKQKILSQQICLKTEVIELLKQNQHKNQFQASNQNNFLKKRSTKSKSVTKRSQINQFLSVPQKQVQQQMIRSANTQQGQQKRPIDIFQKAAKNFDCFDCDISLYRTSFFQLVQNTQAGFIQIQSSMKNSNKFIKETIMQYSKSFNKYRNRIFKHPNYHQKQLSHRCLTAANTNRQINFSHLSSRNKTTSKLKSFKFIQKNKKYQTIGLDLDDLQKKELERQIMNRRNNVLKMKNISLVGQAGQLQLCAGKSNKYHQRLTYRQNNNNNLKKKYEIFLKKQKNYQSEFKIQGTLKTIQQYNPYKTQKVLYGSFFQTINPELTPQTKKR